MLTLCVDGTCNSSYLQFIERTQSTILVVRSMLMKASNIISCKYFENIIYDDTNSCMFTLRATQDYESCKSLAVHTSNEVSKELPAPVNLEFKSVFKAFILITKKIYIHFFSMSSIHLFGLVMAFSF